MKGGGDLSNEERGGREFLRGLFLVVVVVVCL